MRRFLITLAVVAFAAGFGVLVSAEETVTGMLVEAGCGSELGDASPSEDHVACMLRCGRRGEPLGILTGEGLYTITGDWAADNTEKLLGLMATQVQATGEVSGQGGQLTLDLAAIQSAR